jgi:hypothetical protein
MPHKETPEQAKKSALESDFAPLYAVAGLTDALADALRSALAETQHRARKGLDDLQSRGPVLERQAKTNADELRTFVITLPEQFKHLPNATKARIAELQTQANDLLAQATATYTELAGRGKVAVDGAVGAARGLSDRTEQRVDDLRQQTGDRVDPLLKRAQETVTQARKNVSGRTATETVIPRSAARSSATRKATSTTRTAEKTAAKKMAAAKKTATQRATAAKSAAKAAKAAKAAAAEPTATNGEAPTSPTTSSPTTS